MATLIACGDVIPGCAAVFEGSSEQDVLDQVAAHAAADHDITEISAEVLAAVRAAIRTT